MLVLRAVSLRLYFKKRDEGGAGSIRATFCFRASRIMVGATTCSINRSLDEAGSYNGGRPVFYPRPFRFCAPRAE